MHDIVLVPRLNSVCRWLSRGRSSPPNLCLLLACSGWRWPAPSSRVQAPVHLRLRPREAQHTRWNYVCVPVWFKFISAYHSWFLICITRVYRHECCKRQTGALAFPFAFGAACVLLLLLLGAPLCTLVCAGTAALAGGLACLAFAAGLGACRASNICRRGRMGL